MFVISIPGNMFLYYAKNIVKKKEKGKKLESNYDYVPLE
jgi:hypothetical protein